MHKDILMEHHFPVRVYYEDTDHSGVVYYANKSNLGLSNMNHIKSGSNKIPCNY